MVSRQAIGLSVAVNEEILFVERVPATRRTEGNLPWRISSYVERGNPVGRKSSGNRMSKKRTPRGRKATGKPARG